MPSRNPRLQDAAAPFFPPLRRAPGTLNPSVMNVNTDGIPGYSGDGLDDAWQAQYFGLNHPYAVPNALTDCTGLTNLFKFTARLIPNNSAAKFIFYLEPLPAHQDR